jgi:hypothetical protein
VLQSPPTRTGIAALDTDLNTYKGDPIVGCLALFLNFLLPGLGTLIFTTKRVQGFIQLVLTIINYILTLATLGFWGIIGVFIHLGLFVWALAATISFMSEQAAKKAVQEQMNRPE